MIPQVSSDDDDADDAPDADDDNDDQYCTGFKLRSINYREWCLFWNSLEIPQKNKIEQTSRKLLGNVVF